MPVSTVVLILGYRAKSDLIAGVMKSICAAAARLPPPYRVVYLDNYSRDGSVQWLADHHPDIDVLLAPYNLMYCKGVNTLVQYAAYRYSPAFYLLVDADNPAAPEAYRHLVDYMESHPRCGIAQPLVRSPSDPNRIYSCGHVYSETHWCRARTELPADPALLDDLPSCSISSTVIRASLFERCGLLDPIFESYYESSDLGFRARAQGFTCACVPKALAYNEGTEAMTADSIHHRYYFNRNRLIFWRLHNERVFFIVAREAVNGLTKLSERLAESEFGLDPVSEGTRRGLAAGLHVAMWADLLPRPQVALHGFDKSNAVLLQTRAVAT